MTSSIVLVNETALSVSMNASDRWVVTWVLFCTWVNSTSTGGIQIAVTTPAGAILNVMAEGVQIASGIPAAPPLSDANQTAVSGTGISVMQATAAVSSASGIVTVVATVIGDGTHAGTITLQFAQTVSNATSTTIKAGSGVSATRH